MSYMTNDYMEKTYAGWLGKLIGVRYGAPTEGMSFEKLRAYYGELDGYVVDFKDFAADDDTNGPMFFLRALEDSGKGADITVEDMSMAWLNYPPYQHGFYWWGGYGISTEHTAYLNLYNGITAPRCGSIEQNGLTISEQIGGQIFIDTWGLVAPNNPKLAAELAQKMASVSHGGNGVYGGMFIAAAISAAYTETDIVRVINVALEVIPSDCDYAVMARDIMRYYNENPSDWEQCFWYIRENYWQDKFCGACHIMPNSAIMIMSLMYGNGEFDRTLNICHMGGWDTDCTVGNIGTIMGVFVGVEGINYDKWRMQINDFFVASSVIGSLNIMNAPACVSYIAKQAYKLAETPVPKKWKTFVNHEGVQYDFELPGSTHGIRAKAEKVHGETNYTPDFNEKDERLERTILSNSKDFAYTGESSLKIAYFGREYNTQQLKIYTKTYYHPEDLHDDRYGPCFSPIVYPGMTVSAMAMFPEVTQNIKVAMYAINGITGKEIVGENVVVTAGDWKEVTLTLPESSARIEEVGLKIMPQYIANDITAYMDDFRITGKPSYKIDFASEQMEKFTLFHQEVSQFTFWNGIWILENGQLSGSTCDRGEAYTGSYDLKNFSFTGTLIPKTGTEHRLMTRVQGAIRSYAIGLSNDHKLVLEKNNNGFTTLSEIDYPWEYNMHYTFEIVCDGATISVMAMDGKTLINYTDQDQPWLHGCIGAGVREGSRCHYTDFSIKSFD